jgi:protein-S-isoprenylcysteine O-methyltransferase
LEFAVERHIFGLGEFKQHWAFVGTGLLGLFAGLGLRWGAMVQASTNFHHIVQHTRPGGHSLVTHGVYSISRHPSYLGWMVWAVSSQVLLGNVLCIPLFFLAAQRFFSSRLEGEEASLLEWYGEEYVKYAARVPTRIPGVPGSKVVQQAIEMHARRGE